MSSWVSFKGRFLYSFCVWFVAVGTLLCIRMSFGDKCGIGIVATERGCLRICFWAFYCMFKIYSVYLGKRLVLVCCQRRAGRQTVIPFLYCHQTWQHNMTYKRKSTADECASSYQGLFVGCIFFPWECNLWKCWLVHPSLMNDWHTIGCHIIKQIVYINQIWCPVWLGTAQRYVP